MNREEYAKLTNEEKRIKVAELCGLTLMGNIGVFDNGPTELLCQNLTNSRELTEVPDYLNDLNAMHEAEKLLTSAQYGTYTQILLNNSDRPWCATAAQRAEAFVLTMTE